MDKAKWMVGGTLSIFLCGTLVALGQQHNPIRQSMSGRITSLTPAQRARIEQIWRLDQAAIAALNAGQYEEMEADARQSIAVGQDSGLAQELLAASLNAQGKTDEALQAYKVIADSGGDFPRNLVPYAVLQLKAGHWTQAVNAYNKALLFLGDIGYHRETPILHDCDLMQANSRFSPDVPQPKELAVALHIAQGITDIGDPGWGSHSRQEEAMSEFAQARQLEPNSALTNYYYGRGWLNLDLRSRARAANAKQAKAAFQKAAQLGAGDVKRASEEALRGIK